MKYRKLGNTGIEISAVSYGNVQQPLGNSLKEQEAPGRAPEDVCTLPSLKTDRLSTKRGLNP